MLIFGAKKNLALIAREVLVDMWGTLLMAIIWTVLHVYGTSKALLALSFDNTNTAFLPRTLMVSSVLIFIMSVMYPNLAFADSLFYINTYFLMYVSLFAMYMTQEPFLASLAVLMCFFGVALSIKHSIGPPVPSNRTYTPFVLGATAFVLLTLFYFGGERLDTYLDETLRIQGIDESSLPSNMLSEKPNIYGIEGFVPIVIGLFTFYITREAYNQKRESYNLNVAPSARVY